MSGQERRQKRKALLETFREGWERELLHRNISRAEVTQRMDDLGFPGWDSSKISKFLRGKVGASLDECEALAETVKCRIDDLLALEQSAARLRERADSEWEIITTNLEEIRLRVFALLTARNGFLRSVNKLVEKVPRSAGGETNEMRAIRELPEYPEFERAWGALELLLLSQIPVEVDEDWLVITPSDRLIQQMASAIDRELSVARSGVPSERVAIIEKVVSDHLVSFVNVYTSEMAELLQGAAVRRELLESSRSGSTTEVEQARRDLERRALESKTALMRVIRENL